MVQLIFIKPSRDFFYLRRCPGGGGCGSCGYLFVWRREVDLISSNRMAVGREKEMRGGGEVEGVYACGCGEWILFLFSFFDLSFGFRLASMVERKSEVEGERKRVLDGWQLEMMKERWRWNGSIAVAIDVDFSCFSPSLSRLSLSTCG